MDQTTRKRIKVFFALSMLSVATLIISHYWSTNYFQDIKQVPKTVMIYAFVYIILHMAKRIVLKTQKWWDSIYYLGLLAMVIPVLWGDLENESMFHKISDFGTLFLIVPILIDGWIITKEQNTETN
jgi:hypothetical protein